MHKSRITIAGLLLLIMYCGFVFAGLRSGSYDWFRAIYTLTFIALTYAAIAARYRGPFWYGFAVAGWAYFLVGMGSQVAINANLATSLVNYAVSARLAEWDESPADGLPPAWHANTRRESRVGICHCAWTPLLGCLGGGVAGFLARRQSGVAQAP